MYNSSMAEVSQSIGLLIIKHNQSSAVCRIIAALCKTIFTPVVVKYTTL